MPSVFIVSVHCLLTNYECFIYRHPSQRGSREEWAAVGGGMLRSQVEQVGAIRGKASGRAADGRGDSVRAAVYAGCGDRAGHVHRTRYYNQLTTIYLYIYGIRDAL